MVQKHLLEALAQSMDLSTEPIPGKPLVEIVGDQSVLIENHCGVLAYCTNQVVVKTKQGCICVHGCDLILKRMSKEQLRICGKISNVQLLGG